MVKTAIYWIFEFLTVIELNSKVVGFCILQPVKQIYYSWQLILKCKGRVWIIKCFNWSIKKWASTNLVRESNKAAIGLYEKTGFQICVAIITLLKKVGVKMRCKNLYWWFRIIILITYLFIRID